MKAIALIGSPRRGGNTEVLADEFLRGAADAGADVGKVVLDELLIRPTAAVSDDLGSRVDLRADDDFPRVLARVLAADVLLFASPVYWQGVTAQMKCFADRISAYWGRESTRDGFRGMGFAVVCAYAADEPDHGRWVTGPVRRWAELLEADYLGEVCVRAAAKGAVLDMPEALRRAYELGERSVLARRDPMV